MISWLKKLFFIPNDVSWLPSSKSVVALNPEWKCPFTEQDKQITRAIVRYIVVNTKYFFLVFIMDTKRNVVSSRNLLQSTMIFFKWVMWSIVEIELILQLHLGNRYYCFQGRKTRSCIIASIRKLIEKRKTDCRH